MSTEDMLIAGIIALWGALGTCVGVIHVLYKGRVTDRDNRIATLETQLREQSAKADARDQAYQAELQERYETLAMAVANTTKQNEIIEAMNRERERERERSDRAEVRSAP